MISRIKSLLGRGNTDDDEVDLSSDSEHGAKNTEAESGNYLAPDEAIWYRDKVVMDGIYARTYAVDNWPPLTRNNMFISLAMNANVTYDFSIHADPYDDLSAVDTLENIEKNLNDKRTGDFAKWTPNKGAIKETETTVNAMKQHVSRGEKLFDASFYITIYADDSGALEDAHDDIMNNLDREARVSTNQCLLQQKQAMISNSPVGDNKLAEMNDSLSQLMLGDALSRTFPFVEDTFMEEGGVLFGINENSYTPVILDVFGRKNGYNMITSGMLGSGKSFSSSQILMSMDITYNDLQQFIIDPMGDFSGVNTALGGKRIVLNGTESINPLDIEPTPKHVIEQTQGQIDPWGMKKEELRWFFNQFFMTTAEESLSSEELSTLDDAITRTYARFGINEDIETHHKESPTITDLRETLKMMAEDASEYAETGLEEEIELRRELAIELLLALQSFKPGGEYHNLAQPTDVDMSSNRIIYLDLQQIPPESDDMGIMMQLLFMKLYSKAKATQDKVAITIDEAHKLMRDANITGGLEEMFRHSRHFDISINLISQTPEEFYATETARTIAKQCTIKRFHRVDSLDRDIAKDVLKMNDNEIHYIENAEAGEGDKDYSQGLLRISDEDRSIPLQIRATNTEALVIDYDPSDSIQDYDSPSTQALKQALDTYNQTTAPIFVGPDDELNNKVKAEIAFKERNRKRVLAAEDPSLLNERDREEFTPKSTTASNEPTEDDKSEDAIKQSHDGLQQEAKRQGMSTKEFAMKRRLKSPEKIDNLGDDEVGLIVMQYDLGSGDESVAEQKELIKAKFFGSRSEIANGSETPSASDGSDKVAN